MFVWQRIPSTALNCVLSVHLRQRSITPPLDCSSCRRLSVKFDTFAYQEKPKRSENNLLLSLLLVKSYVSLSLARQPLDLEQFKVSGGLVFAGTPFSGGQVKGDRWHIIINCLFWFFGIVATICRLWEIQCLSYAGFLQVKSV